MIPTIPSASVTSFTWCFEFFFPTQPIFRLLAADQLCTSARRVFYARDGCLECVENSEAATHSVIRTLFVNT